MTNSIYKEAVRASFNNYVMVNQTLVKHFKDANPALLLGYLIQEECFLESQDKLDQYGYFYCKTQKLEDKYGFSYKVQDRILDSLVENQLVQVVVKRIEGSEGISKVKHFKIDHENVCHLVTGAVTKKEAKVDDLPKDLLKIQDSLKLFAESQRATYVKTTADKKILTIAKINGFCPEIHCERLKERHKRLKGKTVTAKYLLTAIIPNIIEAEKYEAPKVEYPKIRVG
ncbi:MAG: hypothetical protein B7X86_14350 [Sphingobacteriales bacterium 17-39-43]|uniref:hypothetical protein n=1 Tax=Daejeonella sp. TaxID=2805397 RepID=UPI000BCD8288|nr:hypothetical protein [Daejeonella sp.]OYZ30129.1 MAG: hypothetical protein B7Y24_14115 [Sphingobacteriales bacterium 16-39-50]OZA22847.1 MAG: hypothetical protein B7X86_14350 [Sphingobacteriales bacterium 17-39-43]HQT24001.1 hypothetical protein [Daejeonella sp.]HQT58665.1 hypothetical protein [Daejeonella sp.]